MLRLISSGDDMQERAVGAKVSAAQSGLEAVIVRVDKLELLREQDRGMASAEHVEVLRKLSEVAATIGQPDNGSAQAASGLFAKIESMDKRIRPFEKLQERLVGALLVAGPLIAALWWFSGDKLSKFFHG